MSKRAKVRIEYSRDSNPTLQDETSRTVFGPYLDAYKNPNLLLEYSI